MSEWISVKDKLPESYVFVLVFEKRIHEPSPISIARWEGISWNGLGAIDGEHNSFYSDLFWDMNWKHITHWMPLPEPPITLPEPASQ